MSADFGRLTEIREQGARHAALALAVQLHAGRGGYADDIDIQTVLDTAEQFRMYIRLGVEQGKNGDPT